MLIAFHLVLFGVLGVKCIPQGRQLPLFPNHLIQQGIPIPSDGQNVIFLPKGGYQQQAAPTYLTQNGVVYLRDDPQQPPEPGYIESIYNWFSGEEEMKPNPGDMEPPSPQTPPVEQHKPEGEESSSTTEETSSADPDKDSEMNSPKSTNEEKGAEKKPLKLVKKKTSSLEDFEPDAELIPDTVKNNQKPVERRPPFFYPSNPGIVPGQKFYILNTPNQFVGGPFFGYSPINNHIRPQPSVRFQGVGGFPHRFLILGQQPTVQTQGGQAVILLGGPPNDNLRSIHAQTIQIPAAGSPQGRQEDLNPQQEDNLIPQPEQIPVQDPHHSQYGIPQEFNKQQVDMNERFLASIAEQRNQLLYNQQQHEQQLRFAQQQLFSQSTQLYQLPPDQHHNLLHPSQTIRQFPIQNGANPQQFYYPASTVENSKYLNQGQITSTATDKALLEDDSETIDAQFEASGDSEEEMPKKAIELVRTDLSENPAVAHSKPSAVAVAGRGGSAQAFPSATALAGPQGLAVSDPTATALAGARPYKTKTLSDE